MKKKILLIVHSIVLSILFCSQISSQNKTDLNFIDRTYDCVNYIGSNLIKINGQSNILNNLINIDLSIYNNSERAIAISLEEFNFFIDKNNTMEHTRWDNTSPPSSRIILFDSNIKCTKYIGHFDEIRTYKKLPKFLIIDDSAHIIIKKIIQPNENYLFTRKNRIFTVLHYATFAMLNHYIDMLDSNKEDVYISNYIVKNDFPEKKNVNFRYEINLFGDGIDDYYYTDNQANFLLNDQQAKYLGIIFLNYTTCLIDVQMNKNK